VNTMNGSIYSSSSFSDRSPYLDVVASAPTNSLAGKPH
jgi:hypothetical protein